MLLGATAPAAFAQVVLVPAPAPRYEQAPAPRPGYAWQQGYWQWEHGRYAWTPGGWTAADVHARHAYPDRFERASLAPAPRVERLSADALFPFDRGNVGDISASGRADIAQIAARLRSSRASHVEVRGYTDRLGSDSYNMNLSQQRANAIKSALVAQGVPAAKIRAVGLGAQDPIAQCNRPSGPGLVQCLQPNRRVELVSFVADDRRWAERYQ
ncbi:OmpA family protein [Paraburkholderia sp. SG-MS1]|uniref:OmpA family protein n=1 Tax=Paraburkholderia sp. SG-MS1 TaxID=2023741 RepID=UPI0014475AC2|nr:OmpA family protein [Paraburkholderia sp. SG-MS1]